MNCGELVRFLRASGACGFLCQLTGSRKQQVSTCTSENSAASYPPLTMKLENKARIGLGKLGVSSIEGMGVYGMALGFHGLLSF